MSGPSEHPGYFPERVATTLLLGQISKLFYITFIAVPVCTACITLAARHAQAYTGFALCLSSIFL